MILLIYKNDTNAQQLQPSPASQKHQLPTFVAPKKHRRGTALCSHRMGTDIQSFNLFVEGNTLVSNYCHATTEGWEDTA